eukprot:scaffold206184_cov22-Tisochrysis_lutea.AAC.1
MLDPSEAPSSPGASCLVPRAGALVQSTTGVTPPQSRTLRLFPPPALLSSPVLFGPLPVSLPLLVE